MGERDDYAEPVPAPRWLVSLPRLILIVIVALSVCVAAVLVVVLIQFNQDIRGLQG
jgi:hypothetical protein